MENNFGVLIQAILDSSKLGKSDIEKMQKVIDKYHINLTADLDKANTIAEIKKIVPEIEKTLKDITGIDIEINDKDLIRAFNQVEKEAAKAAQEEQKVADAMEKARVKSEQLRQAEEKRQQLAQNKAVNKALEEEYALRKKIADEANNIKTKVNLGDYDTQILSYETSLQKLGVSSKEIEKYMSSVKVAYSELKNSISSDDLIPDKVVENVKILENEIKKLANESKQIKLKESLIADNTNVEQTIVRLNEQLRKNTAYSKEAKQAINDWINELSNGNVAESRLKEINVEAKKLHSNMASLDKIGFSNFDKLKNAWEKYGGWAIATGSLMTFVSKLCEIPNVVYDVDTAMTNLYKVTDETDIKYQNFLNNAKTKAQELGRSVSGLVDQTSEWAKLGFNIDDASKLAENSSIYANVGEVDDTTAVKDMVSALKAFNIEASDSIEIVDKLNILGNNFATSSADLGEGLRNSASALAFAGNDINKSLAMLTGGTEITQNASEMGNALKVLSMRIRGMKGELEALGEESDGIESISKIQTQILNLSKGKVNIFDDEGNFRDTYDILQDIANIWDQISQTDQASLLEILAGKQRGNQIAALIQSFQSGQAQKAYADAVNSEGSAMQEQERWLQSLEAKTKQFEAAWESLSVTILDSDFLKGIVDTGTGAINVLDKIIDKFGTIPTLLTTVSGILGSQNIGKVCKCIFFKSLLNYFEYAHSTQDYNQELGRLGLVSL